MKARALIPVAGLIVLPLAACQGTSATVPSASPVTAAPSSIVTTATPSPSAVRATPAQRHSVSPVTTAPASAQCTFRYQHGEPLPDPACTPGDVLTTSTADVCSKGWAAAHREYFSKAEREAAFAKYGVVTSDPAAYGEYDHLIPLELGGSNSPLNLWPEKGGIPNAKDAIENVLHEAVCSGKIPLRLAQQEIRTDWVSVPDTFQAS